MSDSSTPPPSIRVPTMAVHDVRTIDDLVQIVTPVNIQALLVDLGRFLAVGYQLKKGGVAPRDCTFIWVDDGRHDVSVQIRTTSEPPAPSTPPVDDAVSPRPAPRAASAAAPTPPTASIREDNSPPSPPGRFNSEWEDYDDDAAVRWNRRGDF